MPTSASHNASPSRPSETRSTSTASRRVFDTVETLFFKEGEELANPVPIENDDDEVTELVPRPKRKTANGLAVVAAALVLVLAILVF